MEKPKQGNIKQLEIFDNIENGKKEEEIKNSKEDQKPFMTEEEIRQNKEDNEGLEYWQK